MSQVDCDRKGDKNNSKRVMLEDGLRDVESLDDSTEEEKGIL